MIGSIATRQKCGRCGGAFKRGGVVKSKYIKELEGLVCPTCFTQPDKVYIVLKWRGKRYDLRLDKAGVRYASVAMALQVLEGIRVEERQNRFDPELYTKAKRYGFDRYFKTWVEKYKGNPATYRKIKSIHKNHLLPFFENYDMREIKGLDIQEFLNQLKGSDRYRLDLYTWLIAIIKGAYQHDVIAELPKFPPKPRFNKKRIPWLTQEEQVKVLNEIPAQHRDIFWFLIKSGVRVSEACALKRDCLTDTSYIIKRTFSDRELQDQTKNRKEQEKYLPESIKKIINRQMVNLHGFVFTNPEGRHTDRHYTEEFIGSIWRQASNDAGVEIMPLKNGTRHSWATQRAVAGFTPEQLADGLGHGDSRMTRNYMSAVVERQKAMYED